MTPSLETRDLTIRFGGHVAVDHVSCAFRPGELTAIVGPNGAGKTTYFNLMSGQLGASDGAVMIEGEDVTRLSAPQRTRLGLGRAFQLTNLFPRLSVARKRAARDPGQGRRALRHAPAVARARRSHRAAPIPSSIRSASSASATRSPPLCRTAISASSKSR